MGLVPSVSQQQQQCRHFSPSRSAVAGGQGSTPSIKEKLPDPERTPFRFREFDLEGKVFVVTGGGRGLGLTLAEALVEAGGEG